MLKPSEQLGLAIRKIRKEMRISQQQLASAADIQRTYLSEIEHGARAPNLQTLMKLAHGLNIRTSQLMAQAESIGSPSPTAPTAEQHLIDALQRQIRFLRERLAVRGHLAGSKPVDLTHPHDHSHICLLYDSVAEELEMIAPIFRAALQAGRKCIYVADETTTSAFLDALASTDFELNHHLRRGGLVMPSKYETYVMRGRFDHGATMRNFGDLVDDACRSGFTGLLVATEMTWALHGSDGAADLIEYEQTINEVLAGNPLVGICLYNKKRFGAEILRRLAISHPILGDTNHVSENCFYKAAEGSMLSPDFELELILEINHMCSVLAKQV